MMKRFRYRRRWRFRRKKRNQGRIVYRKEKNREVNFFLNKFYLNYLDFIEPEEFFLTTSPEDIEFKKIIWTCILYIIKDNHSRQEVVEFLQQYRFLSCLLLYLDPEAMKFSCISRWQQPQLKDIQLLCLSILLNIIPLYQG